MLSTNTERKFIPYTRALAPPCTPAVCSEGSFEHFVLTAGGRDGRAGGPAAQSAYIARECGQPCSADHYLRTETLEADWAALLRNLSLPPAALPLHNPTAVTDDLPRAVFTQRVIDRIHALDAAMFDEFGYAKRTDVPFEIDR